MVCGTFRYMYLVRNSRIKCCLYISKQQEWDCSLRKGKVTSEGN